MTVIPLGPALPQGSSHLPADSVGHVVVCLLDVAPRRDWPFHPGCGNRMKHAVATPGLVSVPLILTSRWTGVTRYAALWSPDFPLHRHEGDAAIAWLASPRHFTVRMRSSSGNDRDRHRKTRVRFPDAIRAPRAPASAP